MKSTNYALRRIIELSFISFFTLLFSLLLLPFSTQITYTQRKMTFPLYRFLCEQAWNLPQLTVSKPQFFVPCGVFCSSAKQLLNYKSEI